MNTKQPNFEVIIIRILLFGLIWGIIEVLLSPVIKSLIRPLSGMIMPFIIGVFLCLARFYAPKHGSLLAMAVVAALFEFFFAGMILHGAFMAILMEALLAELVFMVFHQRNFSFLIVAVSIQIYSALHPVISRGSFCQSTHFVFFKRWITENFLATAIDNSIMVIMLSIHLIFGIISGALVLRILRFQNHLQEMRGASV